MLNFDFKFTIKNHEIKLNLMFLYNKINFKMSLKILWQSQYIIKYTKFNNSIFEFFRYCKNYEKHAFLRLLFFLDTYQKSIFVRKKSA